MKKKEKKAVSNRKKVNRQLVTHKQLVSLNYNKITDKKETKHYL